MKSNVERFFELYESDPALHQRVQDNIDMYPGSLEIRDALCEAVLLPVAEEMGLPFSLIDLKVYEARRKNSRRKDAPLTEDELASGDDDYFYWLEDTGWENDESAFGLDKN